jgi:ketosteroid isomerase-like protein
MKTLEQRLQEVEDREEIKELTAKYAHWVARGEGAKVKDLFTDDGRFINEVIGEKPNIEVRGRKQLDEFYPALKKGMALPCIHNHIIELDGDNAKGTCTIEVRITRDGQSIIGSGFYADIYRRENGRWKFVERHAQFYHFVPLSKGWA